MDFTGWHQSQECLRCALGKLTGSTWDTLSNDDCDITGAQGTLEHGLFWEKAQALCRTPAPEMEPRSGMGLAVQLVNEHVMTVLSQVTKTSTASHLRACSGLQAPP